MAREAIDTRMSGQWFWTKPARETTMQEWNSKGEGRRAKGDGSRPISWQIYNFSLSSLFSNILCPDIPILLCEQSLFPIHFKSGKCNPRPEENFAVKLCIMHKVKADQTIHNQCATSCSFRSDSWLELYSTNRQYILEAHTPEHSSEYCRKSSPLYLWLSLRFKLIKALSRAVTNLSPLNHLILRWRYFGVYMWTEAKCGCNTSGRRVPCLDWAVSRTCLSALHL